MTFFSILRSVFLGPLKLLFEVIFHFANGIVDNPGFAIIFLSLAMNVLVLPLYRRADAMQEQARATEEKLHDGVAHIKKTFSGNERMMMLQTYYRQNNYSPTNAFRGSVSLLLEIPFFMAAYQFLSHLELLQGVRFGPIADLGAPDQLLAVFGHSVNLLPILMTGINFVSSAIYLRGFPRKTKLQLYALALFFLWFLYASPSGLVFYWTLNNLFSLGKNIFYKLKHPKRVLSVLTALLGIGVILLYFGAVRFGLPGFRRRIVLLAGCVLLIPSVLYVLAPRLHRQTAARDPQPYRRLFFLAALFLTVLTGILIPSTYVAACPEDYVDASHFYNPLWFIVSAAALSAGTFLLWFGVFYWLASPRGKVIFERAACVFCAVGAIDYIFFGRNLGFVSSTLQFDNGLVFSKTETLLNLLVVAAAAAAVFFLVKKWPKKVGIVLTALTVAMAGLAGLNSMQTARTVNSIKPDDSNNPYFTLSTTARNVVVLFVDRGLGEDLPYLMQEKPELREAFDGFTYYSNVVSFGGHTNYAGPALMGGYEYTPVELNKRSSEPLVDKHNEALKVMPVLFSQNGYDVTVCDPPFANYQGIPDLSIYDDYPEIHRYNTKGYFSDAASAEQVIENNNRNFFCFSLMKILPVATQYAFYDAGNYHRAVTAELESASSQVVVNSSVAYGMKKDFLDSYAVLTNLNGMTKISAEEQNHFLFLYNETPHTPTLLREPEYVPSNVVDNTEYDEAHSDRFTLDGETLQVSVPMQIAHYHSNMATMLQIAAWMEYLKVSGVYDNTKIILVSDHGCDLYQSEIFHYPEHINSDMASFFPLLMVKDFNAHGFSVSDEFMTNADVPTISFDGVIENPVNPFTGKPINNAEKTAHGQLVVTYHDGWNIHENNGNTFLPCTWAMVTNNIRDRNDWQFCDTTVVLQEHQLP